MGLGTDDLISVKTDERGRMDTTDLERRLAEVRNEGAVPIAVVATSGTTVLGAFDPLNEIADICEKHEIWLHVDVSTTGSYKYKRGSTGSYKYKTPRMIPSAARHN